jgi:hypothetical protein
MPVEFLTDEQASAYGRFAGPPSQADLERFLYLDDVDRALVAKRRGDHNRLGFGLQLVTVRFLGTFLADPVDVPTVVLDFVAGQAAVADASVVKGYLERRPTRFEHQAEIAAVYGYREFTEVQQELAQSIDHQAWLTGDGPKALFEHYSFHLPDLGDQRRRPLRDPRRRRRLTIVAGPVVAAGGNRRRS